MAKRKKRKQTGTSRNFRGIQGNNEYLKKKEHIQSHKSGDYALMQQDVAPRHKELAAKWVLNELSFGSGAGLILDAGSSCWKLWKETAKAIEAGDYPHLTIYTNNLFVLDEWRENSYKPQIRSTKVKIFGWELDCSHRAFYGGTDEVRQRLTDKNFRPWAVFIGTSGIEFGGKDGILFGYHADEAELQIKKILFQCKTRMRIILATPQKIGYAGGIVFDILDVKGLDTTAPLYLVTTAPDQEEKSHQKQFYEARRIYKSEAMQQKIRESGLSFHWIILDPKTGIIREELKILPLESPKRAQRSSKTKR